MVPIKNKTKKKKEKKKRRKDFAITCMLEEVICLNVWNSQTWWAFLWGWF